MIIESMKFVKFCEIGKNIMGVTVREGVDIDIHKTKKIILGLTEWYCGEDFCILFNRRYEYSHNLEAILELEKTKNLLGLAVLVPRGVSSFGDQLRKLHLEKVKVFTILEYATRWLEERINARNPLICQSNGYTGDRQSTRFNSS